MLAICPPCDTCPPPIVAPPVANICSPVLSIRECTHYAFIVLICAVLSAHLGKGTSSSLSRSRRGPSRRCTTMSTVDSTPPELSSRTRGIVSWLVEPLVPWTTRWATPRAVRRSVEGDTGKGKERILCSFGFSLGNPEGVRGGGQMFGDERCCCSGLRLCPHLPSPLPLPSALLCAADSLTSATTTRAGARRYSRLRGISGA